MTPTKYESVKKIIIIFHIAKKCLYIKEKNYNLKKNKKNL